MVGFFATSSFVKLTYNFQAQQEFLGQGLTSDSFFCKVYLASSISSAELQYRQHNLRPGFTEMFVVGAAQNGLQDVDSGLDTVHVTGSKHLVQRLSTLGLGQGSQAEPCHRSTGREMRTCEKANRLEYGARSASCHAIRAHLAEGQRLGLPCCRCPQTDTQVCIAPSACIQAACCPSFGNLNPYPPIYSGGQTLVVTDRSDGWQLLVVYRWSNAHPTATAETAMIAILTHVPS
ncbi:hypothetical protein KCU94_g154, partial [Aureobasidium melanogenum]